MKYEGYIKESFCTLVQQSEIPTKVMTSLQMLIYQILSSARNLALI